MLHKSFKPAKCKTALNLAKARVKIMKNKKDVQMRQLRGEVAQLLRNGQDQTARIRVEHVVREENTMAAYEMIEIYCELIVARLPIIESQKNCPLDLKEAITSLIFAAPRCGDITELQDVRKHFTAKYGKDFTAAAIELHPACGVSRTLVEKLSVKAPDGPTKVKILKGIAEEHNIQWERNWFKDENLVSSIDTPKKLHVDNDNKIQMEPLNAQIADDLEEKDSHGPENLENPSQSHPRANVGEIPPSPTSHPHMRPSGNVSQGMLFNQSSGTAENAFLADRQQWNMEFKDATAAAQAAAESAERASMAARAAAELSIRGSYRPGLSSVHAESEGESHHASSVLQSKREQGNTIDSSYNQRSPSMEGHQGTVNQQGDISEGHDGRISNDEYSESEVQYDTKQQEFRGSEGTSYCVKADSIRQLRDSIFSPSTSTGDYNWSTSSIIQEYETEPAENPFHGETVEPQNQPRKIDFHSSGFGAGYGAFSHLEYQKDDIDSNSSFGAFAHGISEEENWDAKTTNVSKSNSIKDETISRNYEETDVFKESDEKNYGFDSGTGVFVDTNQRPSGLDINEKVGHSVAIAVFDESGSDDDDDEECILDPTEKYDSPSVKSSPGHVLLHKDGRHLDSELSASFINSTIYSKLIEPLPITFDDDDGSSPRSEKELETENTKPGIDTHNYRNPDGDSHVTIGFVRSSKGTDDTFESNEHVEENQNLIVGSVDEGIGSESPRSFSLPIESKHHSDFNDETYSSSEGGMELNLVSLPGGRRNRPSWRSPYTKDVVAGVSSPTSEAAINDGFGQSEYSSPTHKKQGSSGRLESEHGSTPYNAPSNYEREIAHSRSEITERSYSGGVHENVPKIRAKDPTGYFEFDDSAPEENVSVPSMSKNLQGVGISRRTKASTTKLVSSRPSSNQGDTTKTGQFSSISYATEDSPKREPETTNSSSRIISQLGRNDDVLYELRSETIPVAVEKPVTSTSAEIPRGSISSEEAPRENSFKKPSHVHPKLPDFESFTAHLQSLRTNRQ